MNELTPSPVLLCANCTAELQGEFCHECGQSVKSVLRPVSHMLEDAGDLFFHLDERIVHTLPPLYFKPGFLTLEYFSGRRVRYIAPFRLMFVFCLLSFFFVHLAVNTTRIGGADAGNAPVPHESTDAFASAKTADDVRTLYADHVRELRDMEDDPSVPRIAKLGLAPTRDMFRKAADARLVQLKAEPIAAEVAEADGHGKRSDEDRVEGWLRHTSTIDIGWLPGAVNRRLTEGLAHFKANLVPTLQAGPGRREAVHKIVEGFFSVLPQTMFFMLPVFALVLKLFYAFRRRLYMEHIIVSLHSHAFMFISLLGLTLLGFARDAVEPHASVVASGIGVVQFAMWAWIPVYLLVMQKRVYRQGWPMTILTYWLVGSIYFWLLLVAVFLALVIGMSH